MRVFTSTNKKNRHPQSMYRKLIAGYRKLHSHTSAHLQSLFSMDEQDDPLYPKS